MPLRLGTNRNKSRRPWLPLALVVVVLAIVVAWLDQPPPPLSGAGRVGDGDSFTIGDQRIRLLGLGAPELSQNCADATGADWPCGRAARNTLAAILADGDVHCIPTDTDRYGRLLARCSQNDADIGARLVSDGLAVSTGDYWREEAAAKSEGQGLWQGGFERPSDWREDNPRGSGWLSWLWP